MDTAEEFGERRGCRRGCDVLMAMLPGERCSHDCKFFGASIMPAESFHGASQRISVRSSDHELMWQQLLAKPVRNAAPLQVQLRTALVNAILDGRLPVGLRLPSGREL